MSQYSFHFCDFLLWQIVPNASRFSSSGPTRAFAPDAAAIGWEECRSGLRVDVAIGALFQHPLGDSGRFWVFDARLVPYVRDYVRDFKDALRR
jgi:hypothetical protein